MNIPHWKIFLSAQTLIGDTVGEVINISEKHDEYYLKRLMGLGSMFYTDIENNTQGLNRIIMYEMMNTVDMSLKNDITFEKFLAFATEELAKSGLALKWENDPFCRVMKDLFLLKLGSSEEAGTEGEINAQSSEAFIKEKSSVAAFSRLLWVEKIIWLVRAADDSHKLNIAAIFESDIAQAEWIAKAARDVLKIQFPVFLERYCLASGTTQEQALERPAVLRMHKIWHPEAINADA